MKEKILKFRLGKILAAAILLGVLFFTAAGTVNAASEVIIPQGTRKTFSWSGVGYSQHRIDSSVWTISDSSVARIVGNTNKTCDVQGIARGTCILTCRVNTSYTYYDLGVKRYITHRATNTLTYRIRVAPPVSAVSLNRKSLSLKRSSTVQLKCTVKPADSDQTVKWSSSKPAVAAVSQKGLVTGVKAGTAVITVTASNGRKASCTVKVTKVNPTGIKVSPQKASLERGKTRKLTCTLTPKGAEGKVTWTSSNKKVATVTAAGVVKAVGTGTASITAKLASGKKAVCKITVPSRISAQSINLPKSALYIRSWQTQSLSAKVTPANATDRISWSSSDESVAKVDSKGVLHSQSPGVAVITAKVNGHTASCTVTVLGGQWLDLAQGPITITGRGTAVQNGKTYAFDGLGEGLSVIQTTPSSVSWGITVKEDVSTRVVLAGVNINSGQSAFVIEDDSAGRVTISLMKGTSNTLISWGPGIKKNGEYGTLTIDGEGELEVAGGRNSPAIGSTAYQFASGINILGGTIWARTERFDYDTAVIGAGPGASCRDIHILGGKIKASGGFQAVGRGRTLKAGTTTESNIEIAPGVLTYTS